MHLNQNTRTKGHSKAFLKFVLFHFRNFRFEFKVSSIYRSALNNSNSMNCCCFCWNHRQLNRKRVQCCHTSLYYMLSKKKINLKVCNRFDVGLSSVNGSATYSMMSCGGFVSVLFLFCVFASDVSQSVIHFQFKRLCCELTFFVIVFSPGTFSSAK